ncbi:cold shock domain-containing protein [Candidatus Nomurabacteria bacterium]|nr:cold shock domain-containing protein [Candidatus Nomurabacteria bacterium]
MKFFSKKNGFGFIVTNKGDIYIGKEVGQKYESQLKEGAMVMVSYQRENRGLTATTITFPWYRGAVKFFNDDKGYGFVVCAELKKDVFLHVIPAKRVGITPEADMEVEVLVAVDADNRYSATEVRLPKVVTKQVGRPRRKPVSDRESASVH